MQAFRSGLVVSSLLLVGVGACTGDIGPSGVTPSGGAGSGAVSGGAGIGAAGTTGAAGQGPVDPGTLGVHRLNSTEYNATIADVLGTTLQPANSSWRGGEIGGFDNQAAVLDVDEAQFQRYFDAAGQIADDVFASAALKARVMSCATEDATCVQNIIGATGRRLFRRPLAADEVGTYNKVYTASRTAGETHEGALKQVLRALLSSAEFIYRIEIDPDPTSDAKHPLTTYELASRLSYFLWSSAPDDTLLAAAADNTLSQDDKLRAQIDRMLADPVKSQRFVESFSGQWLGARKLPQHAVDAAVYPDWSPQLANSLTQEMYLYFAEFVKTDRPWTDFMKADINFVDATSAKMYGMQAPTGTGMQRVTVTTDKRKGFAGLGGFLAMSSLPKRTSPTLRGRWILSNLLCQEPPPPPKDVPELGVGGLDPNKNVRVALEEHRKVASCAVCHSAFDPLGLALEQFDGVGKFRSAYADGSAIDSSAVLKNMTFEGIDGLADTVTADPRFSTCVTKVMFGYGLGRLATRDDQPSLDAIQAAWGQTAPTLRGLIQSLALSDSFRTRHGTK